MAALFNPTRITFQRRQSHQTFISAKLHITDDDVCDPSAVLQTDFFDHDTVLKTHSTLARTHDHLVLVAFVGAMVASATAAKATYF